MGTGKVCYNDNQPLLYYTYPHFFFTIRHVINYNIMPININAQIYSHSTIIARTSIRSDYAMKNINIIKRFYTTRKSITFFFT